MQSSRSTTGDRSGGIARAVAAMAAPTNRRGSARAFLTLGLGLLVLGGCATKKDMRELRAEVHAMQTHQRAAQDSLAAALSQNLTALNAEVQELIMRMRGDLGHQLVQIEELLINVQELTGQSQRLLQQQRAELQRRAESLDPQREAAQPPDSPGPVDGGDPDQLYRLAMEQMERGNPATARMALQQILREHNTHPRAPDAQYQIGETYVQEEAYDRAVEELARVMELFPDSPRTPQALFRAGVISEERRNIDAARRFYQRVQSGYPRSDEAAMAAERLRRLGRQ